MLLKKSVKLSIVSALVIATLASTALYPKKSHAFIGIASGLSAVPAIVVISSALVLGGAGNIYDHYKHPSDRYILNGVFKAAAVLWVVGLLLDEENGLQAKYATIDDQHMADQLGLTSTEVRSYNEQIEQVNVLSQNIVSKLAANGNQPTTEQARALWISESAQVLAPDTTKVVLAIFDKNTAISKEYQLAHQN